MSVYKRGGHWQFSKTINGVRHRGALLTARSKAQAEQAEAKIILEIHQGEYGGRRFSATLKDFVDRVFVPWAKANRRSWRGDEGRLKTIERFFGAKRLSEISPFLIERFKVERRNTKIERPGSKSPAKPRSVGSVNRELSLLSRIFSIAITNKEALTNPCRDVKHIPGEQPRTRYLLPEEEQRLMIVLARKPAYMSRVVTLALNTGMRRGELLKLKWEQIDFFRDEIKVTQTKNSKDRLVPMNTTIRAMLWAMKEEAVELSGFVFRSPRRGLHLTDIKKGFNAALKEAGIEDFRFHDLRHTFGTMAADAGVEITSIAEVMGHADIHTTRRYSHATDQGRRRAVEAIERHFNSPVTNRSQRAVGGGA